MLVMPLYQPEGLSSQVNTTLLQHTCTYNTTITNSLNPRILLTEKYLGEFLHVLFFCNFFFLFAFSVKYSR